MWKRKSARRVRAERLELVDDQSRVRVVLGQLPWHWDDGGAVHGLELYDATGEPRLAAIITPIGPSFTASGGGNVVFAAGYDDPPADLPWMGTHLELASPDGRIRVGWRLGPGGWTTDHDES